MSEAEHEGAVDSRRIGSNVAVFLTLGTIGSAVGLLIVLLLLDFQFSALTFEALKVAWSGQGLSAAVGSLGEVVAAVLGISLTVVAIVVQLAAQRYPAKIVDVFMFDKVNVGVFGFMTASCIYVLVAPMFAEVTPTPHLMLIAAIVLGILNFGLLLPYFAHVFAFLEPTNLISEIEERASSTLERVAHGEGVDIRLAQRRVAVSVDRIADNCMAAVAQSDRNLALHSLRTLEAFMIRYLSEKSSLPAEWSRVEWDFFGTLAQEFVDEIVARGTWLEAKGFMEFERVLRRAIEQMSEVVSQLARSTRVIGQHALALQDSEVVELVVRFFNTYIRHGLNHRNVRAVYNILYEYRRLALDVLEHDQDLARRIIEHLIYYGRTANEMGIPFVTVTVAHDVRVICEAAHRFGSIDQKVLLGQLLKLDQPVEGKRSAEVALVGVRKAQGILGAFYLHHGDEELANLIRKDMEYENPIRLRNIRDDILAVRERKFWEITDRGHNFDYVEPELRARITEFFGPLLEER